MPLVVVDDAEFFVVVFAAPLDGLDDVPTQMPPVGVPGAVFADGQRARSAASDPGTGTIEKLR